MWHSYLGFAVGFLVIGLFWIGHHRRFRLIVRSDKVLLSLNLVILMIVAVIPFATSVISENGNTTATVFHAGVMVALGGTSIGIAFLDPTVARFSWLLLIAASRM